MARPTLYVHRSDAYSSIIRDMTSLTLMSIDQSETDLPISDRKCELKFLGFSLDTLVFQQTLSCLAARIPASISGAASSMRNSPMITDMTISAHLMKDEEI